MNKQIETFPDWPEFFADDIPVEISGDGPGHDEGEDAGLAGVVQSKESVEKRHLKFIWNLKFWINLKKKTFSFMNLNCKFNLHSSSHWMNIWTLVFIFLSRKVSRP